MEDRFNELMRDAAQTYRKPPEPDFEAMWNVVASESFGVANPARASRSFRFPRGIGIAATLLLGIGIGRATVTFRGAATTGTPTAATASIAARTDSLPEPAPYSTETSQYLGQTAALLIALPSEVKAGRANEQFLSRAGELLTRTRLLLDSPAANDPTMRNLLEDLELVLAQVVHLENNQSRTELDLINRALEQRDVIPRLRTAAADISAN
ncbi:MAG TPA: hypothetical protein VGP95_04400 [Gemmatimonadaceae bacterium]|nr:hypothetical protein [Gemmatimonadaceae bacterium]